MTVQKFVSKEFSVLLKKNPNINFVTILVFFHIHRKEKFHLKCV